MQRRSAGARPGGRDPRRVARAGAQGDVSRQRSGRADRSTHERKIMKMPVAEKERAREAAPGRKAPLATRTDLSAAATKDIAAAMNGMLADVFALYGKTKNFHWHMSGPHFRDYHLLLDEQADQIYAMADPIAERVRKLGGSTLRSIGHIARTQRVLDNDAEYVQPLDMLAELRDDSKMLAAALR